MRGYSPLVLFENRRSGSGFPSADSPPEGEKRCGGCAKTTCAGGSLHQRRPYKVLSGSTQPKAAPAGCFAMTLSAYNGTPVPHMREQLGEILGGVRFP